MILIVAGNHSQAELCARRELGMSLARPDVRVVTRCHDLRGYGPGATVVCYGTWFERPDFPELNRHLDVLAAVGVTIRHV